MAIFDFYLGKRVDFNSIDFPDLLHPNEDYEWLDAAPGAITGRNGGDWTDYTILYGVNLNVTHYSSGAQEVHSGTITGQVTHKSGIDYLTVSGWNVNAGLAYQLIEDAEFDGNMRPFRELLMAGEDSIHLSTKSDRFGGGASEDFLDGRKGDDFLKGGDGNDTIVGGRGRDTLQGGSDHDTFVFDQSIKSGTNDDTVLDFDPVEDKFELSASIFKHIGAEGGSVIAQRFVVGSPSEANDRLIYNSAEGLLIYDADGNGVGAGVIFAHVTPGLALTSDHFILIA